MAISASDVKKLREMTNVGMMDCKKALMACDGDMDAAIDYLREKGLAKAAKKADRVAAEGMAYADVFNGVGVVIEVNCETDFATGTDEEMYRDHTLDSALPVPVCTATTYNYYRQSGLQLSSWDSVFYESLLRNAAAQGDGWLLVRFDRREDYDAAIRALIDQGGIMTVLENCGLTVPDSGITYSRNDSFLEFSVQLPQPGALH